MRTPKPAASPRVLKKPAGAVEAKEVRSGTQSI